MAQSFKETRDCLVDDTDSVAVIKDRAMLLRLIDIEKLDQGDKKTIVNVIDSLLGDAEAKKACTPVLKGIGGRYGNRGDKKQNSQRHQ